MNIRDLMESLDYMAQANLTPFIWGHAGIGKTAIAKQYAKNKGYLFFGFYLGTQADLGDVLGLQEFDKTANGRSVVNHAIPKWLGEVIDYCEANPDSGAVIFLDEFNLARKDILNGMFSLALDKTFHTLKLPSNCHLIAAGNPPTDEYSVTDINSTALMSRFVHIKLEPTLLEWFEYADKSGLEPSLVGFFRNQPELLDAKHDEFELPVKHDRRGVERASKLFKVGTPDHLLYQLLGGILGLERVVAYQAYLKSVEKPLSGEEILSGQKFDLVKQWSNPEHIQASFLNVCCDNLEAFIRSIPDNMAKNQKANLLEFMQIIPKDIAFRVVTFLVQTGLQEQLKPVAELKFDKNYEDKLVDLFCDISGKPRPEVTKDEKAA